MRHLETGFLEQRQHRGAAEPAALAGAQQAGFGVAQVTRGQAQLHAPVLRIGNHGDDAGIGAYEFADALQQLERIGAAFQCLVEYPAIGAGVVAEEGIVQRVDVDRQHFAGAVLARQRLVRMAAGGNVAPRRIGFHAGARQQAVVGTQFDHGARRRRQHRLHALAHLGRGAAGGAPFFQVVAAAALDGALPVVAQVVAHGVGGVGQEVGAQPVYALDQFIAAGAVQGQHRLGHRCAMLGRHRPLAQHVDVDQHAGRVQVADRPFLVVDVEAALVDVVDVADPVHAGLQPLRHVFQEAGFHQLDVGIEHQHLAVQVQVLERPGHAGTVVDVVVEMDELHIRIARTHRLDRLVVLGAGAINDGDGVAVMGAQRAQQVVDQVSRIIGDGYDGNLLDVHGGSAQN